MEDRIILKVPLYLCDQNRKLRPDGLLKLLIEASVTNSEKIEAGDNPDYWVLYSWYINLYKDLYWKDTLEIQTSSRKIKGFYAFRNFVAYRDGEKILEADTKWLLISSQTRRVIKIPADLAAKYGQTPGFEYEGPELKPLDDYEHARSIQVRKADIDINGHVNNSNFLAFALDGLDLEKSICKMQIIYKKEIKADDQVDLVYTQGANVFSFVLKSGDTLYGYGEIDLD